MLHLIDLKDLHENFNTLLGERWGLLTAAAEPVNPMTVGWGQAGRLWNLPVCTVYVRPQRFTKHLMDEGDHFSLCFLPEAMHEAAVLCGTKSGRDMDKVKEAGLTVANDQPAPYYAESELVLICRKLYQQDMEGVCFTDKEVDEKDYPLKDYHTMYVGKIEAVLKV